MKLKDSDYKSIVSKIIETHSKAKIDHLNYILNKVHSKFIKGKDEEMPDKLRHEVIKRITQNKKEIGLKYSFKNQTKIIYDTITEYYT